MENSIHDLKNWASDLQNSLSKFKAMVDGLTTNLPDDQKAEVQKELDKLEKERANIAAAMKRANEIEL